MTEGTVVYVAAPGSMKKQVSYAVLRLCEDVTCAECGDGALAVRSELELARGVATEMGAGVRILCPGCYEQDPAPIEIHPEDPELVRAFDTDQAEMN